MSSSQVMLRHWALLTFSLESIGQAVTGACVRYWGCHMFYHGMIIMGERQKKREMQIEGGSRTVEEGGVWYP